MEQENARLLAITRGETGPVLSEVERLRAQLAAAEQKTSELSAQLARKSDTAPSYPSVVKMESEEAELPPSSAPSSRASPAPQYVHKSGAGLGLMVCTFCFVTIFGRCSVVALGNAGSFFLFSIFSSLLIKCVLIMYFFRFFSVRCRHCCLWGLNPLSQLLSRYRYLRRLWGPLVLPRSISTRYSQTRMLIGLSITEWIWISI